MQPAHVENLLGWLPVALTEAENDLLVQWAYFGDMPLLDPFFEESLSRSKREYASFHRYKSYSQAAMLPEWSSGFEPARPAAVIFHVSRCGSTLVSQLLSTLPANVVLSEVPFFDALLRWGFVHHDEPASLELLKAAVRIYGRPRYGKPSRLFIKADSWHIHFYAQYRKLYPDIPFILLYRHPAEVLTSQRRMRGLHAVPGLLEPEIFGFDRDKLQYHDLDGYLCNVLHTYFEAFRHIVKTDPLAFAVNYQQGAEAIMHLIATKTNMVFDPHEQEAMRERMKYHAKSPSEPFAEQNGIPETPSAMAPALAAYERLEQMVGRP